MSENITLEQFGIYKRIKVINGKPRKFYLVWDGLKFIGEFTDPELAKMFEAMIILFKKHKENNEIVQKFL